MKVVILAGGMGTRIGEESQFKPKPMIEIGGRPILWHIMKSYSFYGFNEFIICCGYKEEIIKKYFIHYPVCQSDSTFGLENQEIIVHQNHVEPWKVTMVNTGLHTLTAGRILKIKDYLSEEFFLTYGDGVSNVNISELIAFHHASGKIASITTVQPPGRFGGIGIDKNSSQVMSFREKSRSDQAWVNAGFMVLNKEIINYLGDGNEMLEDGPFEKLVQDGKMAAYKHRGFWSPMDTLRDKKYLEELWNTGVAPWKVWD